jgi:hypothetical protein
MAIAVRALLRRSPDCAAAHPTPAFPCRRLWVWWHLLSLDAPTIAVLWAHLFARTVHVQPGLADEVVLAGAVWLTYSADRVLDGCLAADPNRLRTRHRFARRYRNRLAAVWLVVLLIVAGVSLSGIDRALLDAGVGVLGVVVLYLGAVHLTPDGLMPDWIKRSLVAIIFSLGSALPAAVQTSHPERLAPPAVAFAALCFLNCTAIETWEGKEDRATSRFGIAIALCGGALALLSAAPFLSAGRLAFIAAACAAFGLGLLDATRDRLSAEAVRVLADAVLLTAAVSLVRL